MSVHGGVPQGSDSGRLLFIQALPRWALNSARQSQMPIALTPPIFCIINSYPVFSLRIPQTPSNPDSQLLDNLAFSFPEKIGGIRRELLQIPTTTSTHLAASAPPTPSPHLS